MIKTPIVTIMGHVNHGKTTLLDCIRNSNLVSFEPGPFPNLGFLPVRIICLNSAFDKVLIVASCVFLYVSLIIFDCI